MTVLILDNSLFPEAYRPEEHWTRHLDRTVEVVAPPRGGWPKEPGRFGHVIITGCEGSILEDHDWILRQCELVREFAARGIPVLASCFGHQLLVRAMDGKEHVRRSPTPEFGWVELRRTEAGARDPVLGGLPGVFHVFASHFDEVSPLPDSWETLATSAACPHAVICHRDAPLWGIQPHPEIRREDAERLLDALPDLAPGTEELVAAHSYPLFRDAMVAAEIVAAFLRV